MGKRPWSCFGKSARIWCFWDITMPGRSGLEVLEEMLSLVPNIRVIMCSAVGQEMMIQKALTIGAADFIVKPFKADEFSRIVNRCLEQ